MPEKKVQAMFKFVCIVCFSDQDDEIHVHVVEIVKTTIMNNYCVQRYM